MEVFDKARITSDATCHEAFSLVKGMKKLEFTGLGESATRLLSDAKDRFKDARRRATDAFANKALKTADRISSYGDNTRESRHSCTCLDH